MDSVEGLTLEELVEFYDARDQLLGVGNYYADKDEIMGKYRLNKSMHPEAVWFMESYGHLDRNDPRSLCYHGVDEQDPELLEIAANLGHPLAQALCDLSEEAALQHDRIGLYNFGMYLIEDDNHALGNTMIHESAKLGYADALVAVGDVTYDPFEKFVWYEKASRKGEPDRFISTLKDCLVSYDRGEPVDGRILYHAYHHMDWDGSFLHERFIHDTSICNRVVDLCKALDVKARRATLAWMLVAKRLGIYRDVARLIGRMIWDGRVTTYY